MAAMLRMLADVGSIVAVAAAWGLAIRAYPSLPQRFPIHFGLSGRPDRWGKKQWLWFLPATITAMYAFGQCLLMLAALDPRHPGRLDGVAWLYFELQLLFLYIESRSIAVAHGRTGGLGRAFVPITLALIVATSLLLTRG